jgi:ATP-dependent exoDNAse (exonuclease V) beta subunit
VDVPAEAATDFAHLIGRRLDPEAVARQIEDGLERVDSAEPHVLRVLPALAHLEQVPESPPVSASSGGPVDGLKAARMLATARREASRMMTAEVFQSASALAHARLERAGADADVALGVQGATRERAMEIGTLVHDLMEHLDLEGDLSVQVLTACQQAPGAVDLLQRLAEGRCLERLGALAGRVIGRELPVLLWDASDDGPGAVVSGFIDLVYRDPDNGLLVVADYKTDAVEGERELAERAAVYEPQLRTYARALREALELDYEPRAELWFLDADRIITV